jgi:hypothetical protein
MCTNIPADYVCVFFFVVVVCSVKKYPQRKEPQHIHIQSPCQKNCEILAFHTDHLLTIHFPEYMDLLATFGVPVWALIGGVVGLLLF